MIDPDKVRLGARVRFVSPDDAVSEHMGTVTGRTFGRRLFDVLTDGGTFITGVPDELLLELWGPVDDR